MLTYPDINPVAVRIPLPWGELPIHWYGIMYVIGFAAAWWLARRQAARPGSTWNAEQVDDLIFWVMVGVIVGGRVGYVLLYVLPDQLDLLKADWLYPVKIWQGGMSFHGALAGVILSLFWYAKRQKRRTLDVLDFCATLPGIGICAGRIGNFINGELWGAPTTWSWGFAVRNPVTDEVEGRHASQLYEAALEGLALYLLLLWYSRRPRPRGALVGLALVWYALVRIGLEQVRVPDQQIGYMAGSWLTMGQVLSLPMLVAGIVLLVRAKSQPQPSGNLVTAT
jgi:phosphatidylglycerol:prolipoprotein diacylglycerol transferase